MGIKFMGVDDRLTDFLQVLAREQPAHNGCPGGHFLLGDSILTTTRHNATANTTPTTIYCHIIIRVSVSIGHILVRNWA